MSLIFDDEPASKSPQGRVRRNSASAPLDATDLVARGGLASVQATARFNETCAVEFFWANLLLVDIFFRQSGQQNSLFIYFAPTCAENQLDQ